MFKLELRENCTLRAETHKYESFFSNILRTEVNKAIYPGIIRGISVRKFVNNGKGSDSLMRKVLKVSRGHSRTLVADIFKRFVSSYSLPCLPSKSPCLFRRSVIDQSIGLWILVRGCYRCSAGYKRTERADANVISSISQRKSVTIAAILAPIHFVIFTSKIYLQISLKMLHSRILRIVLQFSNNIWLSAIRYYIIILYDILSSVHLKIYIFLNIYIFRIISIHKKIYIYQFIKIGLSMRSFMKW